ncbi:MAG: hypothetical protein ACI9K2_004341, partial [Myxococcota bacterium]
MAYQDILSRIRTAVGEDASYLVPTEHLALSERAGLAAVVARLEAEGAPAARSHVDALLTSGRIDAVLRLSALGVIAAHPTVRDYAEASRLASEQEFAALDCAGPRRDGYLASAHRHRGVIAFLMGRHEVALEWFALALALEHSAENLGNVMAALLRV